MRLHALALQATRDRTGLPVLHDKLADADIPVALWSPWKEQGKPRTIRRAMTLSDRSIVEARSAALELALEPYAEADEAELRSIVAGMFGGFRAMRQQGTTVAAVVALTLNAVRTFPAWAIRAGCQKIVAGDAGLDVHWAPNDSEIAEVVRKIVAPYQDRLSAATALLEAKVEAVGRPPEKREQPREQRPTYEQIKEQCRRDGLLIGKNPLDANREREAFMAKHGITKEQFDAIPDAKC